MRLETYLDAMCIAHFRMVEADLDQAALPGRDVLYPHSDRQYFKFRQRIIDCCTDDGWVDYVPSLIDRTTPEYIQHQHDLAEYWLFVKGWDKRIGQVGTDASPD